VIYVSRKCTWNALSKKKERTKEKENGGNNERNKTDEVENRQRNN
jgi:hypothetical protein